MPGEAGEDEEGAWGAAAPPAVLVGLWPGVLLPLLPGTPAWLSGVPCSNRNISHGREGASEWRARHA